VVVATGWQIKISTPEENTSSHERIKANPSEVVVLGGGKCCLRKDFQAILISRPGEALLSVY